MKENDIAREEILNTVDYQIKNNDPKETKITYDRLRKEGFDDIETRSMIANCVILEIFDVVKSGKPFNNERYIKRLNELPNEPTD